MKSGVALLGIGLGALGLILVLKKKEESIEGEVRNLVIDTHDDRVHAGNNISMTISFEHKGPNEVIPVKVYLGSHKIWDDTYSTGSSEDWNTRGTGIYAPTIGVPIGFYSLKVIVGNKSVTIPNAVEIYSEGGGQVTDVNINSVDVVGENYEIPYTVTWTGDLAWCTGPLSINGNPKISVGTTLLDHTSPYSSLIIFPTSVAPNGGAFQLEQNGVLSNIVNV